MAAVSEPSEEFDPAAIRAGIADYYTRRLQRFGATPLGVDWPCQATQQMRFAQLLRLCDFSRPFKLDDLGCGYGALLAYLAWRHPACEVDYLGIDISAPMIRRARRMFRQRTDARFVIGHASMRLADYSLASGIFSVQLDQPRAAWEGHIAETLRRLHSGSRRGFAVNFACRPASGQTPRPGLYVTEPGRWAKYCSTQFDTAVEVVDGYGLSEFSLLVRRHATVEG